MPTSADATAVEVSFNKASASFAKAQDLVSLWLSGAGARYPGTTKTDEELEKEENGIFMLEPELAGLGHKPASNDAQFLDPLSSHGPSTAFIREQLLGKPGRKEKLIVKARPPIQLAGVVNPILGIGSKPLPQYELKADGKAMGKSNTLDQSGDEEDVGRSGLNNLRNWPERKRPKRRRTIESGENAEAHQESRDRGTEHDDITEPDKEGPDGLRLAGGAAMSAARIETGPKRDPAKAKRRPTSYLDEVLAEMAKKKKKKTKKKREKE